MSSLTEAILDGDIQAARQLLRAQPALVEQDSPSGTAPLDLARRKGIAQLEAVVHLAHSQKPSERDAGELLLDLLAELSHDHACASWLGNVEYYVWASAIGEWPLADDLFGFAKLDDELRHELRQLADICGGWPSWDDTTSSPQIVSMETWLHRYDSWVERASHASSE